MTTRLSLWPLRKALYALLTAALPDERFAADGASAAFPYYTFGAVTGLPDSVKQPDGSSGDVTVQLDFWGQKEAGAGRDVPVLMDAVLEAIPSAGFDLESGRAGAPRLADAALLDDYDTAGTPLLHGILRITFDTFLTD